MVSGEIVAALKDKAVNLFATLPCDKAKSLISRVSTSFRHIALTSEQEGVGICAGASLAGARPAMLVQSSGVGNMINAICSLTKLYELPLLILVSWRGVYKESIPAQVMLGERLPSILSAIDVDFDVIENPKDAPIVAKAATNVYRHNAVRAVLLNPRIWEKEQSEGAGTPSKARIGKKKALTQVRDRKATLTRFQILKAVSPYLDGKIVVCNLGVPCKELYQVKHQKSNFYMLGSMGLASSIGLGVASFTKKDVVVIDGDGSLLMNLGTLSTIAVENPRNLTILAIDNGAHGSTGNQPTATRHGVDLELITKGSGIDKTCKVATRAEIESALQEMSDGPNFVHIVARSGNAEVPNVPLTPTEIKRNVMDAIIDESH
jgi:sulfopyruvate decarboxylase beta subunit